MDFLVEMDIVVPNDYDSSLREDLITRERARGMELASEGFFKQAWVVPGRRSRIHICTAKDAAHFHELFTSLPAYHFTKCNVIPLVECAADEPIAIEA
jgi:Muconolactone delta-isomerase